MIPAFLTADAISGPLRDFLARCGYRVFGWELGTNWGPTPYILEALRRRLDACCDLAGGQVSVIGFSLGGLLARDLAHDRPRDIDHVVTVVSPFRLPTATPMEPVLRVCAPFYSDDFETERLADPLGHVLDRDLHPRRWGRALGKLLLGGAAGCLLRDAGHPYDHSGGIPRSCG